MEWSQSKLNENKNKEIQSIAFEAMLSFNLRRLGLSPAKFPGIGYCRVGRRTSASKVIKKLVRAKI